MPHEDTLHAAPLFSQLNRKALTRLGRSVVERTFARDETIVRQGEPAAAFFMLTAGKVAVVRGEGTKPSDVVNEIGAPGFFGEMSLLDGAPRMASIRALEDGTRCLVLSRWDFLAELRTTPEIAVAMLPILTQRIRDLDARLGERD